MAMRMDSERDSKTKPQGSAASWGMVKGVMEMSPIEKLMPEWKYSTVGRKAGSALGAGRSSSSSGSMMGSARFVWFEGSEADKNEIQGSFAPLRMTSPEGRLAAVARASFSLWT